jgi:hypothetical protein
MNDDRIIDARLDEAAAQLVASFSELDTDAELDAIRSGTLPLTGASPHRATRPRWMAVAAAVALVAVGAVAVAASRSLTSEHDSTRPITTTTGRARVVSATPPVTDPTATEPRSTTTATTDVAPPVTPASPSVSDSVAGMPWPNGAFVTAPVDGRATIDVRVGHKLLGSIDLSCPTGRECSVESARVMRGTIWVAVTETDPSRADEVVRSRVVSVMRSPGDVVEHLSVEGPAAVQSAGLGADGVLYVHLDGPGAADRQLVVVERGERRVLETGVAGFRLSDDGRFLAVSFADPERGELARFEVRDLVDGTQASFDTSAVNAGPAAWSPDGRFLIVDEQWEDQTAWVVDPWSGSGAPIAGTEPFLDGACFMDDGVIAHRTWNVGYGQGDAQPGVIRLTSLEAGATVAEFGDDLFGDGFRCHPDGSVSYVRRPLIEVQLAPGVSQLEPDGAAPVDLVHIAPNGTATVLASDDLRLV